MTNVERSGPQGVLSARAATADDVDALASMMADFNDGADIALDDVRLNALDQLLGDESLGRVLLFDNGDDRPAGYAVLSWNHDLGGRDAFLIELYLRPEIRGRGLGRVAMAAVEAAARAAGAGALYLMVRPENEPAMRLYRSAGYEPPAGVLLARRLTK
jgi:ribosomal protein S18 acetylase RimI-like enzyme